MLRPAVCQRLPTASASSSTTLATSVSGPSAISVKHALRRAKVELNNLEAANAGYKHAFERTLEIAFGRRGWVRWKLLNTIYKTSGEPENDLSPTTPLAKHFPPVLRPLLPKAPQPQPRTTIKSKLNADTPKVKAKHAKAAFEHLLKNVNVPLVLPLEPNGPRTGWEGKGVVEALRALAMPDGLPNDRKPLPPKASRGADWDLSAHLGNTASSTDEPLTKVKQPQPTYDRPPARNTRQNPKIWTGSHVLTPRFVRRAARRIWDALPPALSFVDGHWRAERVVGKGKGKGKAKGRGKKIVSNLSMDKEAKAAAAAKGAISVPNVRDEEALCLLGEVAP